MSSHYYTHPKEHLQHIIEKGHDWEKTKTDLKYVRNIIYEKLSFTYGEYCYYCKMPLDLGSNPGDIEHIVHKGNDNYKEFSYHPLNLTLTCKKCNTAKGIKESFEINKQNINYIYDNYPKNSSDYKIVHTHFDNYDDHLDLENYIFIHPKENSPKGIYTINICNLYRLDLALGRVKNYRNTYGMGGPAKALVMHGRRSEDEILKELRKVFKDDKVIDKFQALMSIGSNTNCLQIVNELAKIGEDNLINLKKFYPLLRSFMDNFNFINQYYELIKYIKETTTLNDILIELLGAEHLKASKDKLIPNSNGIEKITELINSGSLKIRTPIKVKLEELLTGLEQTKVEFIFMILNNKILLLELIATVSAILTNQQIKYLLPGIVGFDFRFIKKDINKFDDQINKNPQLNIISNLEWYIKYILTEIDKERDMFFKKKNKIKTIMEYLEF
ncbi:hypothetical protein COJ46_02440 [Bacillus sp. AFS077874]|uniref:HNH endonuclease signature motif containing protein n=1 Tax=Bacillus sp. AFS077874 TaxID=2033513 RepID=UPI000BF5C706|nr:HNH endonuclease signature motif containing protein [Bacillus sp. AFS077874]PFM82688.1 hypothetical protein COJ46_02440 [Bacillus sp. AFS077874]